MPNVLIVDDEQSICWGVTQLCESLGHQVESCASAEEGLRIATQSPPDLLILDVRLPGMDGLTALGKFRELLHGAPIILITAFGTLNTAVEAIRSGAIEYLIKPFSLDEARAAIVRALRGPQKTEPSEPAELHGEMVGATPVMQTLFKRIALAAASDANVLIQGESGVGKELAARAIHSYSRRAESKLVTVNIAALSPTLAESELFGHVAGAYTGANQAREGLLVQANGGTLFLDEVADIPLPLQVKLLRALDQGEVLPVGADVPVPTEFRVIAATHQDLKSLVKEGKFRHDLYFRICAFEVALPALRDRPDDIPLLASHFASQLASGPLSLAEETIAEITRRQWYGNVRELRNAMEHASVLARGGVVLPEHLPPAQPLLSPAAEGETNSLAAASHSRSIELLNDPAAAGNVYDTLLKEVEGPMLRNAMIQHDNEFAPAARALGLHRTTLKKKLEDYSPPAKERD